MSYNKINDSKFIQNMLYNYRPNIVKLYLVTGSISKLNFKLKKTMYRKYDCIVHNKCPIELICMNRECAQESRSICDECINQRIHNSDNQYDPEELASELLLEITLNLRKMSLDKDTFDNLESQYMLQFKIEQLIMKGSLKRQNILKETLYQMRQKIKDHQETNIEKYLQLIMEQSATFNIEQYVEHYEKQITSFEEKHKIIEETLDESRRVDEEDISKLKKLLNIKINEKITKEFTRSQAELQGESILDKYLFQKSSPVHTQLLQKDDQFEYSLIANNFRSLKLYNRALSNHDKAIEIGPTVGLLHMNKGVTLDCLRRYDESIIAYEKALQYDPLLEQASRNKIIALRNLQKYEEAIYVCDKFIQNGSRDHYILYYKGICLMDLGRHKQAIKIFDQCIEIDPSNYDVWFGKGMVLYNVKQYEDAIKHLEKAQLLQPNSFDPTKFIIRSLLKMGQRNQALLLINKQAQSNPKSSAIINEQALTHIQGKQYGSAFNKYLNFIVKTNTNEQNILNLSRIYYAQGKYDETLQVLEDLIFSYPLYSQAYYMKGKVYRNQKKYNEAHQMFNKAFSQTMDDAQVYEKIAEVYILQEEYDEAEKSLDYALKINQICPYSLNNKGNLMMLKEEYQQAITWYQKAILNNQDSRSEIFEYLEQYELFPKNQEISSLIQNVSENLRIAEDKLNQNIQIQQDGELE
ncbi:hypothetical protein pb186bvf_019087 [Paramecium bursaria]